MTLTPGFGVRVTQGSKSYFVQRKRKGSTSDRWVLTEQHSFQAARAQAELWYAAMGRVEDPRQVLTERAQAVVDLWASKALTFDDANGGRPCVARLWVNERLMARGRQQEAAQRVPGRSSRRRLRS